MESNPLDSSRLKQVLSYEPGSGTFFWLPRSESEFSSLRAARAWAARYEGKRAGHLAASGYRSIRIDYRAHWEHRLAWLYVHGSWPILTIDHLNGDRCDNRISNLRDVAAVVNAENLRHSVRGASGLPLGVFFNARKNERPYSASLRISGRSKHLGYFDSPGEAHSAYVAAKRLHHAGCTI